MRVLPYLILFAIGADAAAADDLPHSTDPRIRIELFAEQPQLRTPTGIDVDSRGRVWAVESNTHFRPENYDGHPSDRVLLFTDADSDGRADNVTTFADGFRYTMSVVARPVWMHEIEGPGSRDERQGASPSTLDPQRSTQLFLATRREIFLLEDTNDDDVCDRQTSLVHLETKGDYPHNGLAGFAFDARDWVYFGLGENLGEPYAVVGSDGTSLSGGGEGGNVYRMRPDGTGLTLWATGFWNPHASCVDAFGRLFTVDNDPDSRPPCRLLHIIEGGDYGYRFRNGRKGLHPFTAWNGEIRGTLPMLAGTGEAPSGVVAYEHDALPAEYVGNLLATSWGDHRIERFRLQVKGASFESIAEPLLVGGENFRPVGIALAPDGSLYCTDWVLRDYNLHGKGRIWRISSAESGTTRSLAAEPLLKEDRVGALRQATASPYLPLRRTAARRLTEVQPNAAVAIVRDADASERSRYECLLALSRLPDGDHRRVLKSYVPAADGPWDSVQTGMALYFDEAPAPTALLRIIESGTASDPMFIYAGMQRLTPLLRAFGNSQSNALVGVLDRFVSAKDPFICAELVRLLAATVPAEQLQAIVASNAPMSAELRLAALLAARRADEHRPALVVLALERPEPMLRRAAVQWAGEVRLTELRPGVKADLQSEPMTTELFLATLAALELLDGKNPQDFDKTPAGKYVLPLLTNAETPPAVKIQALRLVDPADPQLTLPILAPLLESDDYAVRLEAVRTLQFSPRPEAVTVLIRMAQDAGGTRKPVLELDVDSNDATRRKAFGELIVSGDVKAEAILGLGVVLLRNPQNKGAREFLVQLARDSTFVAQWDAATSLRTVARDDREVLAAIRNSDINVFYHIGPREEAIVRQHEHAEQIALLLGDWSKLDYGDLQDIGIRRPNSLDGWRTLLMKPALIDRGRGRRVFFHPNGPGCYKCHTIDGRGGRVGPDLSSIGRSMSREKLIDSILEPSREVAPQFTTWSMVDKDGVVHTGMIVHENEGRTILGDTEGKTVELPTIDIEQRTPQRTSVMPEKLQDRMTLQEFRDLLAFLQSLGTQL
jgi:putative membrane-bound dehydrogenase-like protein